MGIAMKIFGLFMISFLNVFGTTTKLIFGRKVLTKNTGDEMLKKVKKKTRVLSVSMAQTCSVSQRKEVKVTLPQNPWEREEDHTDDNIIR